MKNLTRGHYAVKTQSFLFLLRLCTFTPLRFLYPDPENSILLNILIRTVNFYSPCGVMYSETLL